MIEAARLLRACLRLVVRQAWGRRMVGRGARELTEALRSQGVEPDVYGGSYFGLGRDPEDRMGRSGYETYTRASSNAPVSAYLLWRFFGEANFLDLGCALGWVVECLRELGLEARGVDYSAYAIDHAAPGAQGHVAQGDLLAGLDLPDASIDCISILETLEHLPPQSVPGAIAELARISRGWVFATIPSFGPNSGGPDGWLEGKVKPERLAYYEGLGPEYDGPVAHQDLFTDIDGLPVEGHLTIASFGWWERRFAEAGFERREAMERRIMVQVERFGLAGAWNVYVLAKAGVVLPDQGLPGPYAIAALERRWGLEPVKRPASGEDGGSRPPVSAVAEETTDGTG